MHKTKSRAEVLAEIYRNAKLATQSIADILPQTEDGDIRREIMRQHGEYQRICGDAEKLAKKYGVQLKEPGPVKKAMMWSAIKMNTATDGSGQHIAELMIRGTVTGITSLKTTLTDGSPDMDGEVRELLVKLIELEEGFEEQLKNYL